MRYLGSHIVYTAGSQMVVRLSALRAGSRFTVQKHFYISGNHFCQRLSKSLAPVRPKGLGKLIKIIHLIRSLTRDLPACSALP
jgi:hypothetical protein